MKLNVIISVLVILVIGFLGSYLYNNTDEEPENSPVSLPGFKTPQQSTSLIARGGDDTKKDIILLDVPFTPQAPFGDWSDPKQQSGCEEATALMAMRWVKNQGLSLDEALKEIIAISDYELENYSHFHDTSAQDFVDRIFKGYFKYDNVEVKYDITADDIKAELVKNNLVIVPANGQKLNNPYYVPPGPLEHALVIRGYDPKTEEFITNDSGTKRGELFRYPEQVVMNAIYDYPTGYHEPVPEIRKVMIIVKRT